MALDPRHLQILLDVARTGSFSAAAKLRNVSQPAISVAVSQLERQFGTLLLERNRRGVTLTAAGSIVARRAEAIEQQIVAAEAEVRLSGAGIDGPLVIGGTPGALASLIPGAVRLLSRPGKALSLRIVEASDPDLNEMLRTARIDFALTSVGLEQPPADLEEVEIERDGFEVVVAPDHPLMDADVELRELGKEPWVLPSVGGPYRRQVDALFFASQMQIPSNLVRCDSLATTKEIVRLSRYITVFPRKVVIGELAGGTLRSIPLRGAPISRSIGVRRLVRAIASPVASAFIDAMRAAAIKSEEQA
ncbi:MAG TPA: LysR family transcriptional regulator [Caulobacteraceae bacterium]|nr:LysR family transcriptional regulator [Caulobacteraceae bacterium]